MSISELAVNLATPLSTISPELEKQADVVGKVGATMFLVGLFISLLWLVSIIDLLTRRFKNSSDKILWFLLIFFLPLIGSVLYLFIGTKAAKKSK